MVAGLRFLAEVAFELVTSEVSFSGFLSQALYFMPLALLWIWTFSGVVTGLGLLAFVAGCLISICVSIFLAFCVAYITFHQSFIIFDAIRNDNIECKFENRLLL